MDCNLPENARFMGNKTAETAAMMKAEINETLFTM
jgi:hypothetical protein